jgi:uncharacterized protein YciI
MVLSQTTIRRFGVMPLRIPRVILRIAPGPAWETGLPEDQPGWDAHAEFIDDLIERGVFVMGGPYTNKRGSMSLWEGMSADEVRQTMQSDPFVLNGVFEIEDVADWTVYVDTRIE